MNQRLVKQMFDACYMAKRTRDMLPPLPEGVQPSYIHYLDCMQELEEKGKQVLSLIHIFCYTAIKKDSRRTIFYG